MILLKNKQKLNAVLLLTSLLVMFFLLPTLVFAQSDLGLEYASALKLGTTDIREIIFNVINIGLGLLGIIAVLIVLYGGYTYMTSAGDEKQIGVAKRILINGGVGMTIVLSSWGIVAFIFSIFGIGTGGGGHGVAGGGAGSGFGALGGGIIVNHYPTRGQKDTPRNTMIAVTFKETVNETTVCASSPCDGVGINVANIKIYKNSDGEAQALLADDVVAGSLDNKTFVFQPKNYLGDSTNTVWYTVSLRDGILKSDGKPAFPDAISGIGYSWQFEVSDKVDLIPPKVKSVIPFPDNSVDTYSNVSSTQATGIISVLSIPKIHKDSNIGPVNMIAGTIPASVSGTYVGTTANLITITVNASNVDATVNWSSESLNNNPLAPITNGAVSLGGGLTFNINPGYVAGNQWTFNVTSEVFADYLRVGNTNYEFVVGAPTGNQIQVGMSTDATATNIATKITQQSVIGAVSAGSNVNITATTAGVAGNSIALVSSSTALNITAMSGGVSAGDSQGVVDKKDQPRNVVVQINFNEPVDPTTTTGEVLINGGGSSGTTLDMSGFTNLVVSAMIGGTKTYISGNWRSSNQYRTAEFVTNETCGVNSCGEDVHCLAVDGTNPTNITVEVRAATLKSCSVDADCRDGLYNVCNITTNICQTSTGELSPQSDNPPFGVFDMARNSLDGNKDNLTLGPDGNNNGTKWEVVDYYNENIQGGLGDNYTWSFWVNDKIDLDPPVIESIIPALGDVLNIEDPIEIKFSKLMLADSLKPGNINSKDHFTLIDNSTNPVGYWIAGDNIDDDVVPDNIPDKTQVYVEHTPFTISSNYRTEVGEGAKDLYQNCFVPAKDTGSCAGVDLANPSCCNGVVTAGFSCP